MAILRSLGVHDGSFHADEVTATVLLLYFGCVDRDKIIRTRDLSLLDSCEYVCDVGGVYDSALKRFDHHQIGYKGTLSSAGMVALYLRDQGIMDDKVYKYLNSSFIIGVDAHDNGRLMSEPGVCTFSHVISNFVPISYDSSPDEQSTAFFQAVDFVYSHLKRCLGRFEYVEQCREVVACLMQHKGPVLVFDQPLPWMDLFFDMGGVSHPALFVIMPSGVHWKLRGIPPNSEDRMKVRCPLPASWSGLINGDLKRVSGIPGAIFCHKGRFISIWESKGDALRALELILEGKVE